MYNHPLPAMLSATVPLYMMEIEQAGGPTTEQLESLSEFSQMLGERGDTLLFGGKPGEAGALATELAHVVAVLSFVPGGIRIFGMHFEARKTLTNVKGDA
jgi:hypothetical protein